VRSPVMAVSTLVVSKTFGLRNLPGGGSELNKPDTGRMYEGLEKCWWGNGTPKLLSPNLITLAEKLGFNVERFSKITGPRIRQANHDGLIS